ncbi:carbohydrate kinase family protein [Schaalia vaccimaxillae]|uniref:carbohydrate kinase family protein n=1 Tax=Schaalia vaccimaxillae TaxID=183916 RepID=UPI0003B3D04C|nr:PfkB family carbohydrate kinase [Schaalia vaccimaxillae]
MTPTRVCVAGPLTLSLVMGPLAHEPRLGEEQFVSESALTPGGSGVQAVAMARLGLDTELVTTIGIDEAGAVVRDMLVRDGVDLTWATRVPRQTVTASLAMGADRALTTFGSLDVPPLTVITERPSALASELHVVGANIDTIASWRHGIGEGETPTWVLCGCRWDATGEWKSSDLTALDEVDMFVLNQIEAANYTHKSSDIDALRQLAWHTPGVIITRGNLGAVAIIEDEEINLPAAPAQAVDTTGAGRPFTAALVWAKMRGLSGRAGLSMALLASAKSTEKVGSLSGVPTLQELQEWTLKRDVPEGYDLSFLDIDDADGNGIPDHLEAPQDDERHESGFESAEDIADDLASDDD